MNESGRLFNTFDLADINPAKGAKFSPNLFAFLSKSTNKHYLRLARVYRDEKSVQWLGYLDGPLLCGVRLNSVLCMGALAQTFAFGHLALTEVPDFWKNYVADGRCAIDPEHTGSFIGDEQRWRAAGGARSCLWCGKMTQRLRTYAKSVVIEKNVWEAAEDTGATA
jgi:hypothetical protein